MFATSATPLHPCDLGCSHPLLRYAVRLANGEGVRIKFENVLQRVEATCINVPSRIELNGKQAIVTAHYGAMDRFLCDVQGVGRTSLELAWLLLPAGTRGKVHGLTSDVGSRWNDRIGNVLSFDRDAGRYVVQMSRDDQLRIRPINLRV